MKDMPISKLPQREAHHSSEFEFALIVASPSCAEADADASVVTRWDFSSEETNPLASGKRLPQSGRSTSPEFADRVANHTSIKLDYGSNLSVFGLAPESDFDSQNLDGLTLEAWGESIGIREASPSLFIC